MTNQNPIEVLGTAPTSLPSYITDNPSLITQDDVEDGAITVQFKSVKPESDPSGRGRGTKVIITAYCDITRMSDIDADLHSPGDFSILEVRGQGNGKATRNKMRNLQYVRVDPATGHKTKVDIPMTLQLRLQARDWDVHNAAIEDGTFDEEASKIAWAKLMNRKAAKDAVRDRQPKVVRPTTKAMNEATT